MKILTLCSLGWLCLAINGWAATPDAGSLLRDEIRRDQPAAPLLPPKPAAITDDKSDSDRGQKIQITGFRLSGLSAVPETEAQAFLTPFASQPLSLEGLNLVAEKFEQWLRGRGLFAARAYVPPQDIKDGAIEIRVLEGRVEGIDIKRAPGSRITDEKLGNLLAGVLPPGAALEQSRLERGLLLMNDLPAISARAVLVPGKELGGSRVLVEAAQGAVLSGGAELDNTGNRFTGDWRLGASVVVNDAYGWGDQWSARATATQGSSFVRASYSLPLSNNGLKAGVALIDSRYALCCASEVAALDSNGEASAVSGFVSYPLTRTRLNNLTASINWASRGFVNRSLRTTTSDKKSETMTLGLAGDRTDMVGLSGLGGYTTYSAQWVTGRIDLDGWSPDRTQDAASAQTHGSFDKLSAQFTHLLRLSKNSALYGSLSGQWAGKNLDSSEKFSLGGPQGVRAYPTGEASGDQGWLLNLEWRQEINRQWGVVGFFDVGQIGLHHNTWATWNAATPTQDNNYSLSGVGVSAVWSQAPGCQITATLATRQGQNPARDAAGHDSDGRDGQVQLWVTANWAF